MSTSAVQPNFASSWKQEVRLRIAEHKNRRKQPAMNAFTPAPAHVTAGSIAARAAARVAARYAQAPSYSQLLEVESRSCREAAVFVPQAAPSNPRQREPEPMTVVEPLWPAAVDWEPSALPHQPIAPQALPTTLDAWENEYPHALRRQEAHLYAPQESVFQAFHPMEEQAVAGEAGDEPLAQVEEGWENEEIEAVEPDLPIHANLIEFPRELVATRKLRPRRVEGPLAIGELERQLSIFEVEPESLSILPEVPDAALLPAWPEPEWSGIELDALPHDELETQEATEPVHGLYLAPFAHRLTAALVDGALIASAFLGVSLAFAANLHHPFAERIMEMGAFLLFFLIGMLYYAVFAALEKDTFGMNCAAISLCTFDGQIPTRKQLRDRLWALLLSLLPAGLGVVWILFDEDHLCWHDRLSKTYLRRR
ncbi:MAG: RDD family protein [Terracidiphilus sp.]